MRSRHCPVCRGDRLAAVLDRRSTLVDQNTLAETAIAAQAAPRGNIELVQCLGCGFVFNAAFDPSRLTYSAEYENSQAYSPVFHRYLETLVEDLCQRHPLRGRTVLEIGCGKGEFLALLCQRAGTTGIGFDPSYVVARDGVRPNVTIVPTPYGPEHVGVTGDLVCARHVIEHLRQPRVLVETVRTGLAARPDAVVFVETPRLEWILERGAFWDIFYEHCSYFAMPVLTRLFEACGFEVVRSRPTFGDQYQCLEARPRGPRRDETEAPPAPAALIAETLRFAARCVERQVELGRALTTALSRRRCAVWGAGAKAVTLLDTLALGVEAVPVVVDVNPRKQGRYVPGAGQLVVAPGALRDFRVDAVLVTNPNYVDEIRAWLARERLDVEVLAL